MVEHNVASSGNALAQQKQIQTVRPKEGMLSVYSNHIALGQTPMDVRIVFGEITDVTEEKIEVTQRVQVNLSWLETKALKEFLTAYVAQYEDRNGTIKTEFEPLSNPTLPPIPNIVLKK